MNIVVVSAHPDDMEIGMGGTAASLVDAGHSLTSVVLTDGRRSPNPFALNPEALARLRKEEAKKAAAVLGIQNVWFADLPDLKSDQNYNSAKAYLARIFSENAPQEIYILHPDLDRHSSHQLAGRAVLDSLKDMKNMQPVVWAYEVWGLFHQWDRLEDISSFIGKKLQAIGEHKSQVACVPYAEGIIGLNRWRAVFADPQQDAVRAAFAEVFIRIEP
jgi:LmbE family N-acetylglucosaminyl deacetylase